MVFSNGKRDRPWTYLFTFFPLKANLHLDVLSHEPITINDGSQNDHLVRALAMEWTLELFKMMLNNKFVCFSRI